MANYLFCWAFYTLQLHETTFLYVIFSFFASCSIAPRTTTPNVVEDTEFENPPFEIIDLTITLWVAGKKESGKGYILKLILDNPLQRSIASYMRMLQVFGKLMTHRLKEQFILPTLVKKNSIKMN